MPLPPRIYFDWAATAPMCAEARAAMEPFWRDGFGNPSSVHRFGKAARMAVESSRESLARALGCKPAEVIFTSGGTEADNLAVLGAARASRLERGRSHVVLSAVEHPAVLRCGEALAREGFTVEIAEADSGGGVAASVFAEKIGEDTALVALMAVNNEVGTVQDVRSVADLAHQRGAWMFCDAVQALGCKPIDVAELGVDMLAVSAHKIGGPQGAGALYCAPSVVLSPLLLGGEQENQRRAGTENVAAIVGFGAAVEALRMSDRAACLRRLYAHIVEGVCTTVPGSRLLGDAGKAAPHLACFEFPGVDAETLLFALDLEGIAASSGSACSSHTLEPSHVLLAMGLDEGRARSTLRLSWGPSTTMAEVERLLEVLPGLVDRNRRRVPCGSR